MSDCKRCGNYFEPDKGENGDLCYTCIENDRDFRYQHLPMITAAVLQGMIARAGLAANEAWLDRFAKNVIDFAEIVVKELAERIEP